MASQIWLAEARPIPVVCGGLGGGLAHHWRTRRMREKTKRREGTAERYEPLPQPPPPPQLAPQPAPVPVDAPSAPSRWPLG
jgi:hypothetical protein